MLTADSRQLEQIKNEGIGSGPFRRTGLRILISTRHLGVHERSEVRLTASSFFSDVSQLFVRTPEVEQAGSVQSAMDQLITGKEIGNCPIKLMVHLPVLCAPHLSRPSVNIIHLNKQRTTGTSCR